MPLPGWQPLGAGDAEREATASGICIHEDVVPAGREGCEFNEIVADPRPGDDHAVSYTHLTLPTTPYV